MTDANAVAVLGLGRMGSAVATRLGGHYRVLTWSRSGAGTVPDPATAVAAAQVVVLCLYDGEACRAVLEPLAELPVVVNLATVAPEQAAGLERLVRARGGRYVHAPVLGSVPAVAAGRLTVLVGGDLPHGVGELLGVLGTVVPLADARSAAAAKLVANGVLGDALLTTRRGLGRAARLGLDRAAALAVLERTVVGGLLAGKGELVREELPIHPPTAQFAVAALLKDLDLLAAGTGTEPQGRAAVRALLDAGIGGVAPDDDVVRVAAAPHEPSFDPTAQLSMAPEVVADAAVLAPLHAYVLAHATGDPAGFRRAFLPTAHIEGHRDGVFTSWDVDTYCGLFRGSPAPDEASRLRVLDSLEVRGRVATATMTLWHGPDTFADAFVLLRDPVGEWRIANKVYERLDR